MNNITLTQKERMILEDQKSHEELCIEKYSKYASQAKDPQLKQIFLANEQSERSHLDTINQMLNGTIPDLNQQQNQSNQQQQPTQQQPAQQNMNSSQAQAGSTSSMTDKDMCSDILMSEKFVSGTYNTAIFEFTNTNARDVLNHIQKEEQQHGNSVFQYMNSKGLYNVQQ